MNIILRHINFNFLFTICFGLLLSGLLGAELNAKTPIEVGIVYSAAKSITVSLTPECAVNGLTYCEIVGKTKSFDNFKNNKIFGRGNSNRKREPHRQMSSRSSFVVTSVEGKAIPVFAPSLGRNPVDGTYVYWVKTNGFKAISADGDPFDQRFVADLNVKPVNKKVNVLKATSHLSGENRLEAVAGLTMAISKNPKIFNSNRDLDILVNKAFDPQKNQFRIDSKDLTSSGLRKLGSNPAPASQYEKRGGLGPDSNNKVYNSENSKDFEKKSPERSNSPQSRNFNTKWKDQGLSNGDQPSSSVKNLGKIFDDQSVKGKTPIQKNIETGLSSGLKIPSKESVKSPTNLERGQEGAVNAPLASHQRVLASGNPFSLAGDNHVATSSYGQESYTPQGRPKSSFLSKPYVNDGSNSGLNTFISSPEKTSLIDRSRKKFRFRLPESYARITKGKKAGKKVIKDIQESADFVPKEENIKFFPITDKKKCKRKLNGPIGAVQTIDNITDLRAPAGGLCTITKGGDGKSFNVVITHCVGNKTVGYGKSKKCFDVTQKNGKEFNEKNHTSFSSVFRFNMNSINWGDEFTANKEKKFAAFQERVDRACNGRTFKAKQKIFEESDFSHDISYLGKEKDKDGKNIKVSPMKLSDKNFPFKNIKIGFAFSKNPKIFQNKKSKTCEVERFGLMHPDSIYSKQKDRGKKRYCSERLKVKNFCEQDYDKEANARFLDYKHFYQNSDETEIVKLSKKIEELEAQVAKIKVEQERDPASNSPLDKMSKALVKQYQVRDQWVTKMASKLLKEKFLNKWDKLCSKVKAISSAEKLLKVDKQYARESRHMTMGVRNDLTGERQCRKKCETYNQIRRETEDLFKQEVNNNKSHCIHLAQVYKKQINRSKSLKNPVAPRHYDYHPLSPSRPPVY